MDTLKTILETSTEPISLSTAKAYLKVDFSDEDSLITSLISQVRERVEQFTGLSLIASQIEVNVPYVPDELRLPYPNHDTITEVKINGQVSTAYTKTGLSRFILIPDSVFMSDLGEKGMYVKYKTTGYCPEGLKQAMLKALDEGYRNRGNTFEGQITGLSENTYAMCAPYCLM